MQCIQDLTYYLYLYIHTFFWVFLVTHFCFLLCVSSHLVALAGNYHTRPVSKSRLVALIFTLAIFHIWAWKSKFTPINLKQGPAFEQQGRPSRSRTSLSAVITKKTKILKVLFCPLPWKCHSYLEYFPTPEINVTNVLAWVFHRFVTARSSESKLAACRLS